tara:strand:- start:2047 stop:2916 length:870 start_codon:yes stop_codon:yes gene_type:complete
MDYNEIDPPLRPRKKLSSCKCQCGNAQVETKSYWVVNLVAAFFHGVNALLMLIFYYQNDQHDQLYDITTPYGNWTNVNGSMRVLPETTVVWEDFSLNWAIFTFHILSFIFQLLVLIPQYKYEEMVEKKGQNWLRFAEYSLSASVMLVCIALTTGVRDFITLLLLCVLNIVTQSLGAINEWIRDARTRNISFLVAWVSCLSCYLIIFWYFGIAVSESDVEVPGFVIGIIIGQFLLFNLFGIVQLVQIYGRDWACIGIVGREAELSYCVLSLVAKTLLGWLIYANVIVSDS